MLRSLLISLALITLYLSALAAKQLAPEDVAKIAEQICRRPKVMPEGVTSVSTMISLAKYFDTMPFDHKLIACQRRYSNSMFQLMIILKEYNENVCQEAYINLLEKFNSNFISTAGKYRKIQNEQHYLAPEVVKVFFMHYAYKISQVCKRSLLDKLQEDSYEIVNDSDGTIAEVTQDLDKFLAEFGKGFDADVTKNGYSDFFLTWKMIDDLDLNAKDTEYLHKIIQGGHDFHPTFIRLSLRIKGARSIRSFRQTCNTILRPAYRKLILPIIRLIGLGLYKDNEELQVELTKNKNLKRIFELTQVCETLGPIEAYDDDSLKPGEVVIMTVRKAAKYKQTHLIPFLEFPHIKLKVIADNSIDGQSFELVDELESLASNAEATRLAADIEYRRKEQENISNKMMKQMYKRFDTRVGLFSFFKAKENDLLAKVLLEQDEPDGSEVMRKEAKEDLAPGYLGKILQKISQLFVLVIKAICFCVVVAFFSLVFATLVVSG